MFRRDLIKLHGLTHCVPGQVHKGLRLHQQDGLASHVTGSRKGFEPGLVDAEILFSGHGIGRHEAGIVAGHLIAGAGIAQKHDEPRDPAGFFEKHESIHLQSLFLL